MKKAEILKLNGHQKYFVKEDIDLVLDLFETRETSHLELIFDTPGVSCHLIGLYVLNENEKLADFLFVQLQEMEQFFYEANWHKPPFVEADKDKIVLIRDRLRNTHRIYAKFIKKYQKLQHLFFTLGFD